MRRPFIEEFETPFQYRETMVLTDEHRRKNVNRIECAWFNNGV